MYKCPPDLPSKIDIATQLLIDQQEVTVLLLQQHLRFGCQAALELIS
jgi:hypothetical protein